MNIYQQIQSPDGDYNESADAMLSTVRAALVSTGWQCSNRNPYIQLQMIADMASYTGAPNGLWTISPPPGVSHKKILIVDKLTPPLTFDPAEYDVIVTGTTVKELVFPYIIQAFQSMGTIVGGFIDYGSDPDNTIFPNTRLIVNESPTGDLVQGMDLPGFGGGFNLQILEHGYGGGYACTCEPNGNDDNYISLFIYRTQGIDSLNRSGPPALLFGKTISETPVVITSDDDSDRTRPQGWPEVQRPWHLAAGPSYAIMWDDNNNFLHSQVAALDLSIAQAGITEATFACAGDLRTSTGFRTSASCSGIYRLSINEDAIYGSSGVAQFTPRLDTLWASNNSGNLWENGLGQIHEPWISFANKTFRKAARLGKFPDAIMMHKSVDPDNFGPFEFDGAIYKAVTRNVARNGNSGFGTLCVKVDDTASNECNLPM